jgi:hypothetical protein
MLIFEGAIFKKYINFLLIEFYFRAKSKHLVKDLVGLGGGGEGKAIGVCGTNTKYTGTNL